MVAIRYTSISAHRPSGRCKLLLRPGRALLSGTASRCKSAEYPYRYHIRIRHYNRLLSPLSTTFFPFPPGIFHRTKRARLSPPPRVPAQCLLSPAVRPPPRSLPPAGTTHRSLCIALLASPVPQRRNRQKPPCVRVFPRCGTLPNRGFGASDRLPGAFPQASVDFFIV